MRATQALAADAQVEAVFAKLQELNPGFDQAAIKRDVQIRDGVVVTFRFPTNNVTDLSPICAFAGLEILSCGAAGGSSTRTPTPLVDLSPLRSCARLRRVVATRTSVTAEQVAALQKALPDCVVEWDGARLFTCGNYSSRASPENILLSVLEVLR